jgi:hypothetical protein
MYSFPTHSILVSSLSKGKEDSVMREKIYTNNPSQLIPFSFSLHIRENNELSTQENQINQLQLFPNPAGNSVTLKLTNQPIQRIAIYDLQGRIVYLQELESSSSRYDIDLSSFNSGLYIVQVESRDGIVSSSKFIKK